MFKRLIGLAALVGVGYLAAKEYQRRKEDGDQFIINLDNQIHNLIDEVGAHVDNLLAKAEEKINEAEEIVEEKLQ